MPQRIPARIELKPAQRVALDALADDGLAELTRGGYQELTGMSRSQAAYDLAELVEAGMLERIGGGRSTRYRLVRESDPTQRQWTNERISAELRRFCAGRTTWPTAREFKRAARTDLYVAASRYGGIGFWAAELGLPRGGEATAPHARVKPLRRLAWAVAGATAGALIVGIVLTTTSGGDERKPPTASRAPVVKADARAPRRRERVHATRTPSRAQAVRSVRRTARPRTAAPPPAAARPAPSAQTVSRSLVRVSPPATTQQPARIVPASAPPPPGPTPLAAPASARTPPPLPAP